MPQTRSHRSPVRLSHLTLAKLIQLLLIEPCTVKKMAEWTGLSNDTLYRFMNAMHLQKVVHIHDWEFDGLGRSSIPVFRLGVGADAQRKRAA